MKQTSETLIFMMTMMTMMTIKNGEGENKIDVQLDYADNDDDDLDNKFIWQPSLLPPNWAIQLGEGIKVIIIKIKNFRKITNNSTKSQLTTGTCSTHCIVNK